MNYPSRSQRVISLWSRILFWTVRVGRIALKVVYGLYIIYLRYSCSSGSICLIPYASVGVGYRSIQHTCACTSSVEYQLSIGVSPTNCVSAQERKVDESCGCTDWYVLHTGACLAHRIVWLHRLVCPAQTSVHCTQETCDCTEASGKHRIVCLLISQACSAHGRLVERGGRSSAVYWCNLS
jgi:hypothetical protein